MSSDDRFQLVVPPDPRHISTARIFAAAVARVEGADEDAVEEVKVGISEACSMSLRDPTGEGPLEVTVARDAERLRFEIAGDVPAGWPERDVTDEETPTPTGIAATLSREVLTAMFEDADVQGAGGHATIRFSIPLAETV